MKIGSGKGSGKGNVIDTGSGDVNVKGLASGVAEGAGKEEGGLTGDRTNIETGGTRTGSVIGMEMPHVTGLVGGAGLALLLGVATEGHQEALFDHIK